MEEFHAAYAVKNSPNYNGSYYFQSFKGHVITGRDDSMKTWKDYWFWVGGSWEVHPQVLKEFRRVMPTTWNLGKQCVEPAKVSDEGLQCIYGILGMPKGKR